VVYWFAFGLMQALSVLRFAANADSRHLYFLGKNRGVALGTTVGLIGFNKVFVALIQTLGIMTASMPPPIAPTFIMAVALVLIAYALSLLIALTIRHINPYRLIVE
jgi:hypothetical protein